MAKDARLTKRQLKKLVKEQTGIVKKDPNNLVSRLKLAGALKDLGRDNEAVTHYQEVAKAYASTGKLVQAISVYKGILEINPGHENTEAALSDLSAQRAQEIKAKSMPRLQQQDDGRWVMPTESDVSEEEGTDPGAHQGKVLTASPSVLRLPPPMPTDSTASRRRRGRRSRPRLPDGSPDDQGTSSTPSFDGVDMVPLPGTEGVPSQPEGFDPFLPSLADHEAAVSPPEPIPPGSSEASTEATTTQRDVDVVGMRKGHADIVLTAEEPSDAERRKRDFLSDDAEEPTSPGPSGYKDTIRKSAVGIDASSAKRHPSARSPRSKVPARRTIVGVPSPEIPDLPETPLASVPPPDDHPTGEYESPLPAVTRAPRGVPKRAPVVSPVENKRTVQMEREPDMAAPPPAAEGAVGASPGPSSDAEPVSPDESADETLGNIFDDEEEALWSELGEGTDSAETSAADEPTSSRVDVAEGDTARSTPAPRGKAKPTLRSASVPAAAARQSPASPATPTPGAPRSGKAKKPRKSSKMTIPMGAAAFKKAVKDTESRQPSAVDEEPGHWAPRSVGAVQLEEIALFRDLSETSRETLQSRLVRRTEKRGTIIVREGDPGNALFVVSSGQVRVTKQDRQGNKVSLASLGPGAFFGEFALLSDRKRHATVTVSEEGVFFEISRKVIADLTKSDPSFGNTLRQFYRRRLLGTLVRSAPFFDPLSEKEREALMGRLRFRRIPEKTKIITEGEPGGGFFLILIGEVEVAKTQPDGSEEVLARLMDGSYFGEMSLLKGGNAVATVTTVTHTEIVQLAAAEFYRILSKYPQIWEEVNREAKRRELANLQILSGRTPDPRPSDDSVVM